MRNRKIKPVKKQIPQFENNTETGVKKSKGFHLEFLNSFQRSVWSTIEKNDIAAINALGAFMNAVEAQRGNKITDEQADMLIADAQYIIGVLIDG